MVLEGCRGLQGIVKGCSRSTNTLEGQRGLTVVKGCQDGVGFPLIPVSNLQTTHFALCS